MIKLVAFDLDGTIADTISMCLEAFRKAVSPYAGHTLSDEEIIQTFGMNEKGMVKALVKDHWEEAIQDLYAKYEELHYQCDKPFDGIVSVMDMLKSRGIIVSLVTGKGQECCKITLEKLNLSDMFSDIMTGQEYKNCKKDFLVALMDKYGLSPDECIYIGDAVSDVTASNEAGIRCLSAAWSTSADKTALYEINRENVYENISELAQVLECETNT